MGMGIAGLMMGAGAGQGLQELLKQRLLERQMALQEQSQAQDVDYRNRALNENIALRKQIEAQNAKMDAFNLADRERAGLERFAARDVTATPVGTSITPERADMWSEAGQGGVVRNALTGTVSDPEVGGERPAMALFRGYTAPEAEKVNADDRARQDKSEAAEEAARERENLVRLTASLRPPTGQVTPAQRFGMERQLRREWNTLSQNWRTMKNQVSTMEAGLQAAERGDMAQGAQAILVTFQKILDPTSVVRESEYARSAEGMSAMNQVKGFVDRMARGGVGVTLPELKKFHQLGKEMVAKAGNELPRIRQQFEQNAVEYGLNPRLIIAEDPEPTPEPAPTPDVPGGGVVEYVRDPKTGKLVRKQ